MDQVGKLMIFAGLTLVVTGLLFWALSAIPGLRFGRLPGDIYIQKPGFTLIFPLTSMLLASVILSLLLLLARAIFKQ